MKTVSFSTESAYELLHRIQVLQDRRASFTWENSPCEVELVNAEIEQLNVIFFAMTLAP